MLPNIEYINPKAIGDRFQCGRVVIPAVPPPYLDKSRTQMKELKREDVDEIYEDSQNFYIFDEFRSFLTIPDQNHYFLTNKLTRFR